MNPVELLPILAIGAVMYFLIIRPQVKEKQDHDKLVASLSRGDKVVTASGLHGVIMNVADDTIQLEIAERTRVTVDKKTISRRLVETPNKAE